MEQLPLNIELPQSDHLLGFKEDKRPSRLRFWLIALFSLAVCGTAVFLSAKSVIEEIKLPTNTVAWAAMRHGYGLPESAPRVWREAAKDTRWPLIVGIAKDGQGWSFFAVTNRWNDRFAAAKKYSGLLVTASDVESPVEALGAEAALRVALSLTTHPAFANLELSRLDPSLDFSLQGPIDGRVWQTNMPLKEPETSLPTDKEFSIDLDTWPEAWPAINAGLKRMLNGVEVAERPSYISWTVASDTARSIDLGFSQAPATSTIYNLAGGLGLYDEAELALPDGSSLIELRWPVEKLKGEQSETSKPGMTVVGLRNENLTFAKQANVDRRPKCDFGKTVAYFSSQAMDKVNIGGGANPFFNGVYFNEDRGILKICF